MNDMTKECMAKFQFNIPHRLSYLSHRYTSITWKEANTLYANAVIETLIMFNVTNIYDIPWGRGLVYARELFEDKLNTIHKFRMENKENDN